jgi:hypothetical protein
MTVSFFHEYQPRSLTSKVLCVSAFALFTTYTALEITCKFHEELLQADKG